ncbi:MAG: DUF3179 domain-containing (seleno)protein [Terriglobia bacterium]
MRNRSHFLGAGALALAVVCLGLTSACATGGEQSKQASKPRTVKGLMQARPGGPLEEVEVGVQEAPVGLPSVPAAKAQLEDGELVLGVVVDAQAMAYPIRYLALYEVVDDRVGGTPLAPTW